MSAVGAATRVRQFGVVARAPKLLIALRSFVGHGVMPERAMIEA